MTPEQQMLEDITQALLERETGSEAVAVTTVSISKTSLSMPAALADRLKDVVVFEPLTPNTIGIITGRIIDRCGGLSDSRKEEAKAIVGEIIASGSCGTVPNGRAVRHLVDNITSVAGEGDLRAAITEKYPAYGHSLSVNSGRILAESFNAGTAGETKPLRPLRLKSRGVVFFALH